MSPTCLPHIFAGRVFRPGILILLLLLAPTASAQERTMVVYLPSAPTESAARVAAGITQLAAHLSERTGMRIEAKAFRRAEDAAAYLASAPGEAAVIVSDQAFLLDLPSAVDVSPAFRFVRGGREARRKIVVVRNNDRATSLAGLRGRTIAAAIGSGGGSNAYLARLVFGGEIDPQRWFSRIVHEPDDFTAATNVMFGRVDAALVSEDNPLVVANLGKQLREVFELPAGLPSCRRDSQLVERGAAQRDRTGVIVAAARR